MLRTSLNFRDDQWYDMGILMNLEFDVWKIQSKTVTFGRIAIGYGVSPLDLLEINSINLINLEIHYTDGDGIQ